MEQKVKRILSEIVVIVVIVCGIVWVVSKFVHVGNEFTDNAQVCQHIVPVNSRIQGFIRKVYFTEYQHVRKGDTLVVIEDAEFRLKLAQAQADYQNVLVGKSAMHTTISTTQNNLSVSDAGIEEVHVNLENAKKDYERYTILLAKEAVTQQQYDAIRTAYETLRAKYDMLLKQKKSTSLTKVEQTQRLKQQDAGIEVARAAVALSRLNLSYTVIVAPCDGVVGRKTIQDGQLVQVGQTLLSVVDENDKWVIANYKETQTAHITENRTVEMTVDALPGVVIHGVVNSLSGATGAQYSIVSQDNSAGNFIKVEQLIPIKITFTKDNQADMLKRLRAGMNVECKVTY
jgi:membrane fusion protein, multidrug efflux system